jgi:mRNA-degrading endonuclease toxin of MazEF toxin-antitoxin module
VSSDIANSFSSIVIVAPVTSQETKHDQPWDLSLVAGNPLPRDGRVMCNQLRAVAKARLERRVGALSPVEMAALEEKLKVALGMDGKV